MNLETTLTYAWHGQPRQTTPYALLSAGWDGRDWYERAASQIREYSRAHDRAPEYVCDVIAILSPRVTVERNIQLAHEYITTGECTGAMASRITALDRYETWGIISGPKVRSFARALRGDPFATVIDAWMFRLLGEPSRSIGAYQSAQTTVRCIAQSAGMAPAETQAALWTGIRHEVGFHASGEMVMPC